MIFLVFVILSCSLARSGFFFFLGGGVGGVVSMFCSSPSPPPTPGVWIGVLVFREGKGGWTGWRQGWLDAECPAPYALPSLARDRAVRRLGPPAVCGQVRGVTRRLKCAMTRRLLSAWPLRSPPSFCLVTVTGCEAHGTVCDTSTYC